MREKWAKRIVLLTGLLVLLLAIAFATSQNPTEPQNIIESREHNTALVLIIVDENKLS